MTNRSFSCHLRISMVILSAMALVCLPAGAKAAPAVEDFTFIHVSDLHVPFNMDQTEKSLAGLNEIDSVDMRPFEVTAPAPSFVIATGDLTEYGGGHGWWEDYRSLWDDLDIPVYHNLGNHDNTWHALIRPLRKLGYEPYYSFEAYGCLFISLMSASIQDPRPSFGEEQIVWLREELKKASPQTPVFVFFHHPLAGGEFASPYDWHRVLDELRPYNVALVLVGHSHSIYGREVQGVYQVGGGSTFGPNSGRSFVTVKDGMLRVAYQRVDQEVPMERVLEKPLSDRPTYPQISINSPEQRETVGSQMTIQASVNGIEADKATYTINDDISGDMTLQASGTRAQASATIDTGELLPGSHYVRVTFHKGDQQFNRSSQFFVEHPERSAVWRKYMAAASKSTPVIADGRLFVGANDGVARALNAATGDVIWSVKTGAEILVQPLVIGNRVVFANGLGEVAAYNVTNGRRIWRYTADEAVYSSPVYADGKIVFGCNDGHLHALDAESGRRVWLNQDATYAIEAKPWVHDGKIYFGAWDEYVRCVDARTGNLIWEVQCEGSRTAPAAKRYYSAADAMPVVAGGRLFIADRMYMLSVFDAQTGELAFSREGVAGTGLSEDGQYVYLRMTGGDLTKIDTDGNVIWSVDAGLNFIPTAPVERSGIVYVASATGKVSAVSARFGRILWQYQASPGLFVMSNVASDGQRAYVTAFDGHLTALPAR